VFGVGRFLDVVVGGELCPIGLPTSLSDLGFFAGTQSPPFFSLRFPTPPPAPCIRSLRSSEGRCGHFSRCCLVVYGSLRAEVSLPFPASSFLHSPFNIHVGPRYHPTNSTLHYDVLLTGCPVMQVFVGRPGSPFLSPVSHRARCSSNFLMFPTAPQVVHKLHALRPLDELLTRFFPLSPGARS